MSATRNDFASFDKVSLRELQMQGSVRPLGGTLTMADIGENTWQNIDANGAARTVKLPDPTKNAGKVLLITNFTGAANALTLQNADGSALAPATTVAQNKGVLVASDGTVWKPVMVGA